MARRSPQIAPGDVHLLTTALKTDRGINNALDDIIATTKNPSSKVIVYGYSLGGTDALDLSRSMDVGRSGRKIHLLITVDAAVPFSSEKVDRRVGQSVRRNLNFFQKHLHFPTNTHGGPNAGANVINIDRSFFYSLRENQGHILIHDDTVTEIIDAMHKEFFNR